MTLLEERISAIHLLRAGQSVKAVADEMGRTRGGSGNGGNAIKPKVGMG